MDIEPQPPIQNDYDHDHDQKGLTALPIMPQHLRTDSIDSATSTVNSSDTSHTSHTSATSSSSPTDSSETTAPSSIASSIFSPPSPTTSTAPSTKSRKQVRFDPESAQTSFFDWDSEPEEHPNPLQTSRLRFNGSNIRRTLSSRPSTSQLARAVKLARPAKPAKPLQTLSEDDDSSAPAVVKVRGESGEFSAWLARRGARGGVGLLPESEAGVGPAELMEPAADSARARRRKGEGEGMAERVLGKRRSFFGLFGRK